MKLRIRFGGLCLFVPELAGTGEAPVNRMHVLLPRHVAGHHVGQERHVPVLCFDSAHLRNGRAKDGDAYVVIRDRQVALASVGGGASLTLCRQLLNVKDVTDRPVDPRHLRMDPDERELEARITLEAGAMTAVKPGGCWAWESKFQRVAHMAEWTIDGIEGDQLTVIARELRADSERTRLLLHPDDTGLITLSVMHAPVAELPIADPEDHGNPPAGAEPPHFSTYYRLFGGPVPIRLPRFWGSHDDCPHMPGDCEEDDGLGASAFTCMVAGAW